MDECNRHPGREGTFFCQKYGRRLCEACARCPDPGIYCKFRSMCIIWEMTREERKRA